MHRQGSLINLELQWETEDVARDEKAREERVLSTTSCGMQVGVEDEGGKKRVEEVEKEVKKRAT